MFLDIFRCSFGSNSGASTSGEDESVADLHLFSTESGRRNSVSILRQLSSAQAPVIVGRDEATVNLSGLPSSEVTDSTPWNLFKNFARVKPIAVPRPGETSGGRSEGMAWTESRKLLEAAIMFEQVDPSLDSKLYYRQDIAAQEERLEARLSSLGLSSNIQIGDGNCQFRSLSFGLYGTPKHHASVRRTAVDYINRSRGDFEVFLGEDFRAYAKEMAKPGVWGDELTLRAACESYGVVINVVTSDNENWFLRYVPEHTMVQHEVFLSYIAPVHYNAIRKKPRGSAPILRSMSSLGRRNSRIVAALDEYERTRAIPQQPTEVLS